MNLQSNSFGPKQTIPVEFAFGKFDKKSHCVHSENRNPHLAWSDFPTETKSFVLVCHDGDVPSRPDDVNQEGKTVSASLERVNFYHWVMVDIPVSKTVIEAGEFSDRVTAKGKPGPELPSGMRHGLNNYTQWFAGDGQMEGNYFGYDGPCPPWNDEIIHHYHFTVYALDVERCPVEGSFDGPSVLKAIEGHVLGRAKLTGIYSINPNAR